MIVLEVNVIPNAILWMNLIEITDPDVVFVCDELSCWSCKIEGDISMIDSAPAFTQGIRSMQIFSLPGWMVWVETGEFRYGGIDSRIT